jgi:hypothetical protein
MKPRKEVRPGAFAWAVAATSLLVIGAAGLQSDEALDWLGVTRWSGTIRVEVTQESNLMDSGKGVLIASASGSVNLELADVRDGPRRAIWVGDGLAFSATHQANSSMGNGTIVLSESGEGVSQGGSVELLIDVENLTYTVDFDVGDGIPGQATIEYVGGFGNETKAVDLGLDELDVRTDDLRLPSSSPGDLTGSFEIDVGTPDGFGMGSGRKTGTLSWSLLPCIDAETRSLEIDPFNWDALVFDMNGSELNQVAIANNINPEEAEPSIYWTFPEIEGVTLTTDPEDGRGNMVGVEYQGMPEDNAAFDVQDPVKVTLPGCSEVTAELPARFFFSVAGKGNPDDEDVPNWFYYWRQTPAGQGLARSAVRYEQGEMCNMENGGDVYGFYPPGADHIYLCDAASGTAWNKVTGEYTDGIDTYAVTVLHELEHKRHYDDWWREFDEQWKEDNGRSRFEDTTAYRADRRIVDRDGDDIPDDREASLGMDTVPDTHRCKMTDEHYLAWLAEGLWQIGAADKEDWAAPGKQHGKGSPPVYPAGGPLCGIAKTGRRRG